MGQFVTNGGGFVSGVPTWGNVTTTLNSADKIFFTSADAATVCGWAGTGWYAEDEVVEDGKETHPTTPLPPHH